MNRKIENIKNKILTKIISDLQYLLIQMNKSGVKSKKSTYIYQPSSESYIVDLSNYDYPLLTDNKENAMSFSDLWFRGLILYKFNSGLEKENKFIFKNYIGLSGGNFGFTVNTQVNNSVPKSLGDIDNMSMDEIK